MADAKIAALLEDQPAGVKDCVQRIEAAGGRAWLVGGAVRDALVGLPVRDFDLATTLPPDRLVALFPKAVTRDLHLGAIALVDDEGAQITVTALREEGDYADHRHPGWVRFIAEPGRDALRRDFTVNALYVDPHTAAILDPCGGLADLHAGELRAIGDPLVRLAEDPLRMLRAVRFAGRCALVPDAALRAAFAARIALLETLSAERVFAELTAAFTKEGRGRALRELIDLGAASMVLPEAVAMIGVPQSPDYHPEGDVLTHVCLVLDQVAAGDPVQAWAAVAHDLGKPPTFERAPDRIRFHGHDHLSAAMAERILRRLRAPRELRETVVEIARDHIRFASLPQMAPRRRERWLRSPRFAAHLAFHRADCLGSHGDLGIWSFAAAALAALPPVAPPPLCTGRDVLALGLPAGPVVGAVLRELNERLDAMEWADRPLALALLEAIVRDRIKARG